MDNNENNHINLKKEENKNDKLIDITSFCEEFSGVIGKDLFKEEQNTELIENQLRKTALEQKIIEKTKDTKISPFIQSEEIKKLQNSLDISLTDENKEKIEYLKKREYPKYDLKEYEKIKKRIGRNLLNISNFLLKKKLKLNLKEINQNKKIGPLLPLTTLIENSYKYKSEFRNEMQNKYLRLKNYICNYRTIYGDGNCYYRAVMFRYIELLILNKKSNLIKLLILDINQCFSNKEAKMYLTYNKQEINSEIIIQIMIIIYQLVENDNLIEAHQCLYKSILCSKDFDFLLIFYFRFILYEYIKNNEKKLYMESFPILLGNLLPSIYENNGIFDFASFYQNFLLKMFIPAEKIIIYLTPFIFGIDLDIILFDDEEIDVIKHFKLYENNNDNLEIKQNIFLINRKNHYEIVYNYFDNKNYNDIYDLYRNDLKPIFIHEDDIMSNIYNNIKKDIKKLKSTKIENNFKKEENLNNKIKNKNQNYNQNKNQNNNQNKKDIDQVCLMCSKQIYIQNKTLKKICQLCLFKEIFSQIKKYYKDYLHFAFTKINQVTKDDLNNLFFNKISVNIFEKILNINQIIEEMEFSNKIEPFIKRLMTELKKNVCIYCHNDINNKNSKYQLPCGCCFCSIQHLSNFFKQLVKHNLSYNYKCICSIEYKPYQILELCSYLKQNRIYESNDAYNKHLSNIFKNFCCKCGLIKNKLVSISINNLATNFHNLCEECGKNNNFHNNNTLQCIICNKNHMYL